MDVDMRAKLPWAAEGSTEKYNKAVMARRLMVTDCTRDELCAVCGESLHPYPEPERWMQYPLPNCIWIDELKIHDHSEDKGRWDCIHKYLADHPTLSAPKQMELFT